MHRCVHLCGADFVRRLFQPVFTLHMEAVSLTGLVYLPGQLAPADPLPLPSESWQYRWATTPTQHFLRF